ncbi:MAG: TetR/AcrR family transcriptional regulator [Paracoccaceae bacterium]
MARKSGSSGKETARLLKAAATRLFARYGYAAVSMRQIAAEVGVQAGALYLYTPDKQSLLAELMVGHLEELHAAWRRQADAGDDPLRQLDAFVRFHIAFHVPRIDQVFIAYMELRNLDPENFRRVEDLRRAYEDILEAILRRGQERQLFDLVDARLSTMAIIAMLTGVNTWYREGGRLSVGEIEAHYVELVRRLVWRRAA